MADKDITINNGTKKKLTGYIVPSCPDNTKVKNGSWELTDGTNTALTDGSEDSGATLTLQRKSTWYGPCPEVTEWTWTSNPNSICTKTVKVTTYPDAWTLGFVIVGDTTVKQGGTITLKATLTPNLEGKTIKFYRSGSTTAIASKDTNANGVAETTWTVPSTLSAGTYKLRATYSDTDGCQDLKSSEKDDGIEITVNLADSWNIDVSGSYVCSTTSTQVTYKVKVTNNNEAAKDVSVSYSTNSTSWTTLTNKTDSNGETSLNYDITNPGTSKTLYFRLTDNTGTSTNCTLGTVYYAIEDAGSDTLSWGTNTNSTKNIKFKIVHYKDGSSTIIKTNKLSGFTISGTNNLSSTEWEVGTLSFSSSTGVYTQSIKRKSGSTGEVSVSIGVSFEDNDWCIKQLDSSYTVTSSAVNNYTWTVTAAVNTCTSSSTTPKWTITVKNNGTVITDNVQIKVQNSSGGWDDASATKVGSSFVYSLSSTSAPYAITKTFKVLVNDVEATVDGSASATCETWYYIIAPTSDGTTPEASGGSIANVAPGGSDSTVVGIWKRAYRGSAAVNIQETGGTWTSSLSQSNSGITVSFNSSSLGDNVRSVQISRSTTQVLSSVTKVTISVTGLDGGCSPTHTISYQYGYDCGGIE